MIDYKIYRKQYIVELKKNLPLRGTRFKFIKILQH